MPTQLSPRHAARHRLFPMTAVETTDGQRSDIDPVETAHVDINLIGVGARNVKRMNAAGGAKRVLGDAGIKPVCGQRLFAAQKFERLRRHDEMQKSFFGADRTIAFGHARQIRGHTKAHASAMAPAFVGLQREASRVMAGLVPAIHVSKA